jgi:hypothetical protein
VYADNLWYSIVNMKKTIKIILIIVGIIILILVVLHFSFKSSALRTTNSRWVLVPLVEDGYKSFFPLTYHLEETLKIVKYDNEAVSIEHPEIPGYITIGYLDNSPSKVLTIDAGRTMYLPEGKDPVFKIWVEKVSPSDYNIYKDEVMEDTNYVEKNKYSVKRNNYENNYYEIYLRPDLSADALKNAGGSIGGVYTFFPEKNVVVFMNFFNTTYQGCYPDDKCKFYADEKVLNMNEIESIVHQMIDSVVKQ